LASESVRNFLGAQLDTTFSYGILTPEFQHFFRTNWKSLNQFNSFIYYKNLILISDLRSDDIAYQVARTILPPEQFQLAETDSNFIYAKNDFWAKDQMFILIAGKNLEKMRVEIFNQREQKKTTRYLWQNYHWTLRIPSGCTIIREDLENQFIWFGMGNPYRWISITWSKGTKEDWLTPNGLYAKREIIGSLYGDVKTEKRFLGYNYVSLSEWNALKMYGLWYSEVDVKGGPFSTYAFYDSNTDRTFVIDFILYAPSQNLTRYYKQLEVMVKTLTTSFTEDLFES
jgi:hypothetical protein